MTSYNGHPSRNYWNVSLWIGNDEGLYRMARHCIGCTKTRKQAAELFVENLAAADWPHRDRYGAITTPDGAPWTVNAVIHGMRGLDS